LPAASSGATRAACRAERRRNQSLREPAAPLVRRSRPISRCEDFLRRYFGSPRRPLRPSQQPKAHACTEGRPRCKRSPPALGDGGTGRREAVDNGGPVSPKRSIREATKEEGDAARLRRRGFAAGPAIRPPRRRQNCRRPRSGAKTPGLGPHRPSLIPNLADPTRSGRRRGSDRQGHRGRRDQRDQRSSHQRPRRPPCGTAGDRAERMQREMRRSNVEGAS
jgi:hypothetical protein